ncbi:MAG: prolipoprotein diacylglyceryl transferase [Propionibacteriaceae bacterium]|jgi:prolipoprotein diacylglyceryl transferase|nr:prolipoprotein diacylglyceryl transferase [Propionibacteriaceae bacterium]
MTPLWSIPSPPQGVWQLGPLPIRAYAICVLTGILVACWGVWRRWRALGGDTQKLENLLLVTVVGGMVGARLYFVIIEWPRYFGPDGVWYHVFYVWQGGLGIMGGVGLGAVAAWAMCRRYRFNFLVLADCVALMLPIAQGIGRLGNWWNQELYGRPTDLPWGLVIDPAHRVAGYQQYSTFHPTFLYEMIWDFALAGLLWALSRSGRWGRGKIFATYLIGYSIGRSIVESFRIDPVELVAGLRVNSWAALGVGLIGLVWLIWLIRHRPGGDGPGSAASRPGPDAAGAQTSSESEPVADSESDSTAPAAESAESTADPAPADPGPPRPDPPEEGSDPPTAEPDPATAASDPPAAGAQTSSESEPPAEPALSEPKTWRSQAT